MLLASLIIPVLVCSDDEEGEEDEERAQG